MSPYFKSSDKQHSLQIHDSTEFTGCCGARILMGLYLYLDGSDKTEHMKIFTRIAEELRQVLENDSAKQAVYCILSQEETHKGWYTILKLCGFEDVHSFVNGNTGNSLTLYVLNPTEEYEGEEEYEDDF